MTTEKQKKAVKFCEQFMPEFNGNIDDFTQVSKYLSKYLNRAKEEAWKLDNSLATEHDLY